MLINFINTMSNKYPKIFLGVGSVILSGYAIKSYTDLKGKHDLIEKVCYEKGKLDGYKNASLELKRNSQKCFERTLKYSKENLENIESLKPRILAGSVDLYIRPSRPITLLGESYIITSFKNNFGWLVPLADYREFQENTQKIIEASSSKELKKDVEHLKNTSNDDLNNEICAKTKDIFLKNRYKKSDLGSYSDE